MLRHRFKTIEIEGHFSGARCLLEKSEPRNTTKSHHAPNFTKEIHCGEALNVGCLCPGTKTAEEWALGSPNVGFF